MEIEIYTVRNCGNCKKVKAYLDEKRVQYKEINMGVGGIPELQQKKKEFKSMGITTYPVTLIKEEGGILPLEGFHKEEFDRLFHNWVPAYDLDEFDDVEDIHNIPYTLKQKE